MTVIRQTLDQLEAQFPLFAEDLAKRGITASIEVFSENCDARFLAYEWQDGRIDIVYGSRSLYNRWKRQ